MISIAIPAHNEEKTLADAVASIKTFMDKSKRKYEIIICEDGSTDRTNEIARDLASKDKEIRLISSSQRLGRGLALARAFKTAKGEILIYTDADLSIPPNFLLKLINKIEGGYDIVTGSRLVKGARVKRSLKRETASRFYNFLVRVLFGVRIHDMQCGFKAFKRKAIFSLLKFTKDKYWFWDSEILIRAHYRGCKIAEIPVKWVERNESKVSLLGDIVYFLIKLVELRVSKLAA